MDINLDLIKRIISSDDLCDKVNSSEYKGTYKEQIKQYVMLLIDDVINNKNVSNFDFINRYIKKFVIFENISKEDKFFDDVVLKVYSLNINNEQFIDLLKQISFFEIKELLIKKYDEIIKNNTFIDNNTFVRILKFYCFVSPNCVLPNIYIDYFISNVINRNLSFDYYVISYLYKAFASSYSSDKIGNIYCVIEDVVKRDDPYYECDKNKIIIYKQNISNTIDYKVLADIFYQIKYLYLIYGINNRNNNYYTFEQLKLVKEISLISILGKDYFENNYKKISFTYELRKNSYVVLNNYLEKIGVSYSGYDNDFTLDIIDVKEMDSMKDNIVSIDILFDQVIKRENSNLIKGLVRSYPILGSEYKSGRKKTLLSLLLDIYSNKKLLNDLNIDLNWHNKKDDPLVEAKVLKLQNKISICTSYIEVMNNVINNGDMTSDDIIKSISSLITYNTNDLSIQKDICLILNVVIPKKIERLCLNRESTYIDEFKRKVISCYLESMNKRCKDSNLDYFMKLYSGLECVVNSFDKK